jgi:acyl-CoA thioesterase-2
MVSTFTRLIDLKAIRGDAFQAPPAPERSGRMYGGQLLAQGLVAAMLTTEADRDAHSLHAYFLRPGDVNLPVEIEVERVRDGRSFSARVVRAIQHGRELFRMMASFHVPEPGDDYAGAQMPDVPPPEAVSLTYNEFSRLNGEEPDWDGEARPMDIRYINPPSSAPGEPVLEPQRMWVRIPEELGDDRAANSAGLAYLSDSTLIDHTVLPHGRRWQDSALNGASLDHAMWFHHGTRADQWLLFEQRVGATGHARGFAQGGFFDGSGRLVASCAQEGLIRWA